MRSLILVSLTVWNVGAVAQTLGVSPIPEDAERRFCYFAGLSYSPDAVLTIDLPFPRQGQGAIQKGLLVCTRDDSSGIMVWVPVETDPQSTGWN